MAQKVLPGTLSSTVPEHRIHAKLIYGSPANGPPQMVRSVAGGVRFYYFFIPGK